MIAVALLLVFASVSLAARQIGSGHDDRYRFAAGMSEERSVMLAPASEGVQTRWAQPAADRWDTALLGVRIVWSGPVAHIEITAGSGRVEQHFERHALGLRWLNLSGLRDQLSDGTPVTIRTYGMQLETGAAPLRIFSNRLGLDGPILVLAPHPDDAEIAAFGLYAGRNSTIVTVTAGNAGPFSYRAHVSDPAEHYAFKGYLRVIDSVTVPWQGEIPPERCFNLGYFDARLEAMRRTPDLALPEMYGPNQDILPYRRANIGRLLPIESRAATWNHLVQDLAAVFQTVNPSVVVMPHPMLDSHRDHQYTAVAAVEALAQWSGRPEFLLYTNHASRNQYPFGPAGTAMSLPPYNAGDLPVERVYAHRLDAVMQRRKLYALESMHDLRLTPFEQDECRVPGAARDDCPPLRRLDYFRRGPRSEELFFAFGRDGVRDLIAQFLAAQPQ